MDGNESPATESETALTLPDTDFYDAQGRLDIKVRYGTDLVFNAFNSVKTLIDYDQAGEFGWSSYTIEYFPSAILLIPLDLSSLASGYQANFIENTRLVFDDGRSTLVEMIRSNYFGGATSVVGWPGGHIVGQRATIFDAQGHAEVSVETHGEPVAPEPSADNFVIRSLRYEAGTGLLDFASTMYFDLDRTTVSQSYDPATGRLAYETTTKTPAFGPLTYVAAVTDHDLDDVHPWTSFTIRTALDSLGAPTLRGTETVMGDGSTVVVVPVMEASGLGLRPYQNGQRATTTDAQGRLDYVLETHDQAIPAGGEDWASASSLKALDYDPVTGQLDYAVIDHWSGLKERIDYDPATGLRQHQLSVLADGHTVAQDFDVQGRLDYTVERWADGRMTATDYDQADTYSWTSFSIAYDPQGNISSTTLL